MMPTSEHRPPLSGLRIVEVASFVAAPSAGLVLAQLGAEVIRVDPLGGGPDIDRWPVGPDGRSIYWAGLNRGKQSVNLDLRSEDGQSTLHDLVTAPGRHAGVLISNLSGKSWLSDETLRATRSDLIHVQVLGRSDGAPAVDYTVNAATGLPFATGPAGNETPVNHAIPPWDLMCGLNAAIAVLAALRRRSETGAGTYATVALDDVALSSLTTLGFLPEAQFTGSNRPSYGNYVYGTYGVDFTLVDGARVMVVALTRRQWRGLLDVTGTADAMAAVARVLGADLDLESDRWQHRETITALLRPWFATRTLDDVAAALDGNQVLWGRYQHFTDVVDEIMTAGSPVVMPHEDKGFGAMLATTGPIRLRGEPPPEPGSAPALGQDTESVLQWLDNRRDG